jgi:tagatose-1,6-bisphosphate aldolase non-catalytic subunit AgaZ/GatZ
MNTPDNMKKITALLGTVLLAAYLCGCASLETNAYKTIGSTAVAVDASMNAWGDYVRAGKTTVAQEQQVRAAYANYQKSMKTAQALVTAYRKAPTNKPALELSMTALNEAVLLLQKLTLTPEKP